MKKLLRILREKSGSMSPLAVFIPIMMLVGIFFYMEYQHINDVSLGIRDTVQSAVTSACTENYDRLYNGLREGYSGGYKLTAGDWSEDIDTGDIYAKLDSALGTRDEGGEHVRYAGTQIAYSLSDLSVQMTNTPFAPNNPEDIHQFTGVAYVTIKIPFMFHWDAIPPMEARIKIIAGYMAKF